MPSSSDSRSNSNVANYKRFFAIFFKSRGALHILVVSTLFAIGIGTVIGLIPATLAERYARINHGFTGGDCSGGHGYHTDKLKPAECTAGSDDAKYMATWSNAAVSALMLLSNPVVGSISDVRGRRPILLLGLVTSCIPAAVFVLTVHLPNMNPAWYYAANSLTGAVNYLSIVFASLSDVIPTEFRAQSYGLLLSGFYGGFALAPSMAVLVTSDIAVAWLSFGLICGALLLAIFCLPETLPMDVREENLVVQSAQAVPTEKLALLWHVATRPAREVLILNRDWGIRLLTIGSFFAAMVFASDTTLFIYYVEETFDITKFDIACMTLVLGTAGILVQGGLLQPLIASLGEKGMLIAAYCCGTLHNFLYGIARSKSTLYIALITSQFTKTNFPILSSLASKCVDDHEQGRVQGALFATNAIANAVGPLSMEYVYYHTKNKAGFGPGFFFIYAAGLYAVGTVIVSLIPVKDSGRSVEPAGENASGPEIEPVENSVDGDVESNEPPVEYPDVLPADDLREPLLGP